MLFTEHVSASVLFTHRLFMLNTHAIRNCAQHATHKFTLAPTSILRGVYCWFDLPMVPLLAVPSTP